MNDVKPYVELAARIFLAAIFLISGLGKIGHYADTQGYMVSVGVPGWLLLPVIALEVAGAAAIMLGWQTRLVAFVLAGFCLLSALLFHANFQDQMQMILFLKNVAIAGGFLLLFVHGAGPLSLDAHRVRT